MLSVSSQCRIENVVNGVIGQIKLSGCAFERSGPGLAVGPFGANPFDNLEIAPRLREGYGLSRPFDLITEFLR